jgi:Fic family protein
MENSSLNSLLDKINKLYFRLIAFSPKQKWDKDFIEKVKIDFTYNSNKLEGNALTYGETISFLKRITTPKRSQKDLLDIENHFNLLDKVFEQYKEPFSIDFIKEIHKNLMKDEEQWEFDTLPNPGNFKIFENFAIRSSGVIKSYMKPENVENALNELTKTTNLHLENIDINTIDNHPITIATYFHNQFLNVIHPFQDGNGRVGRIITNLILMKCDFPPIFIDNSDVVEKGKYLNTFIECEQQNSLDPMIAYFSIQSLESLERKLSFFQEKTN